MEKNKKEFYDSCTKEELIVYINNYKENSNIPMLDMYISLLFKFATTSFTMLGLLITVTFAILKKKKAIELMVSTPFKIIIIFVFSSLFIISVLSILVIDSKRKMLKEDEEELDFIKSELHGKYLEESNL